MKSDRLRPVARYVPPLDHHALTDPRGRYFGPLFDPDPPAPGPGTQGGQQGGTSAADFERQLAGYQGDLRRYSAHLYDQNQQLASQIRTLEGQRPAQGSIVLNAEQAAQWTAYQAAGKPEDLQKTAEELEKLRGQVALATKEKQVAAVAGVARFDPEVLMQLGGDREYEVREIPAANGQPATKAAFIKDGDQWKPLTDYAATGPWRKFLPSLQVQDSQQGGQGDLGGQAGGQQQVPDFMIIPDQQQQGGQFIPQDAAGGRKPESSLEAYANSFQEARNKAPNPLAPQ